MKAICLPAALCCVLTAALLIPNHGQASQPDPGLYEITVQIDSPTIGLSRTQSSKECITQGQFENGPNAFLNQQQQDSECSMLDYSMADGKIHMSMSCVIPGGGKASVKGNGQYGKDHFSLTNKMVMEAAGIKMDMQTVANGKRVGDC